MEQEQTRITTGELKLQLNEAIEMQKLQTELQELRTRMVTAKANELFAIAKINEFQSEEAKPSTQEEPKKKTK